MGNRPDWKDAPWWAKYLAQDSNGDWYWYEGEPFFKGGKWHTPSCYDDSEAARCDAGDTLSTRFDNENT